MGLELGMLLCGIRESKGEKQQTVARRAGLRAPRLSEIESGIRDPSLDQLIILTQAYPVPVAEAIDRWLADQTKTSSTRDLVRTLVAPSKSQVAERDTERAIEAMSTDNELRKTVRKLIAEFKHTEGRLVNAIWRFFKVHAMGERQPRFLTSPQQIEWSRHFLGSGVEKAFVFAARGLNTLLVELNRVPPRTATIHRQADLPDAPASFEIWSVLEGKSVVLLEEQGIWARHNVQAGSCGSYWGGHRHIWVNASHHSPLIVSQTLFPYRKSEMGPDKPGEAFAVHLDDLPQSWPDDLRSALAPWISKS
jgi:transcriptional regulator with XRE-family HTH domain